MKIVKPGDEHEVPRGILGGAEVSQATTGAHNIYMARFRVPAGARERLQESLSVEPGDMLYVPPRETHVVENVSDSEPADYVVARDSPTEDSVEVPWAEEG